MKTVLVAAALIFGVLPAIAQVAPVAPEAVTQLAEQTIFSRCQIGRMGVRLVETSSRVEEIARGAYDTYYTLQYEVQNNSNDADEDSIEIVLVDSAPSPAPAKGPGLVPVSLKVQGWTRCQAL